VRGVDARAAARTLSLGRIFFGVGLLALPERFTASWVGSRQSKKPGTRLLTRALGARDLGLGAATLAVAASGTGRAFRTLLLAGMIADGTDLTVTVIEREDLPSVALPIIAAAAGSGLALGALALVGDDAPPVAS
jgi:hypothetical protein